MTYWRGPGGQEATRDAIRLMKRAEGLRSAGNPSEALAVAEEALEQLRHPGVERTHPVALTALISLTILVEELASELGLPGAAALDIRDTLTALKETAAHMQREQVSAASAPPGWPRLLEKWIPALEARLVGK